MCEQACPKCSSSDHAVQPGIGCVYGYCLDCGHIFWINHDENVHAE